MRAYRTHEGTILFNDATSQGIEILLPCGQCMACRQTRAEAWAVRMVHESKLYDYNSFLTLTYNDENLPQNNSLPYDDVTKFIKRLRKVLKSADIEITYYRVGEYGENFSRPHYHICIFGFDFSLPILYKGQCNVRTHESTHNGNKLYSSTLLSALWTHGFATIGDFSFASALYVAKYVTKKVLGKNKNEHYQRCDELGEIYSVTEEKSSMSRRPAIGLRFIEKYYKEIYANDSCFHEGTYYRTPAYYDKWLEKNHPAIYQEVKQKRLESMIDKPLDQEALTRSHEFKYELAKSKTRSLEGGAPTINPIDEKILSYNKKQHEYLHAKKRGILHEILHYLRL